ncbi:MAG: carbon-nitrogen hydrolase family protein [Epsilonproteobacteria bacterium]|nr:carbon-nitrogen hydrolase family protein [Campylobacterota bacterium]
MMISKTNTIKTLCTLSFTTTNNYEKNLQTLLELIDQAPKESIVIAPEVCLTSFDYDHFDAAANFSLVATKELLQSSMGKTVVLTMLEKDEQGDVHNRLKVFHNGEIIHQRTKVRLFRLGGEHKYMQEGSDEAFEIIEVDGVKLAMFICYELRFKELWQKSEGADVIAVSAWWGKPRSEHFASLTQALAIMNQCYVVASDSMNEECTGLSGVITPQGSVQRNGNSSCLVQPYSKKEVVLMRRYLDVGIKC